MQIKKRIISNIKYPTEFDDGRLISKNTMCVIITIYVELIALIAEETTLYPRLLIQYN